MTTTLSSDRSKAPTERKGKLPRRRAEALRQLIEKVDAGEIPTERDYRKAGC